MATTSTTITPEQIALIKEAINLNTQLSDATLRIIEQVEELKTHYIKTNEQRKKSVEFAQQERDIAAAREVILKNEIDLLEERKNVNGKILADIEEEYLLALKAEQSEIELSKAIAEKQKLLERGNKTGDEAAKASQDELRKADEAIKKAQEKAKLDAKNHEERLGRNKAGEDAFTLAINKIGLLSEEQELSSFQRMLIGQASAETFSKKMTSWLTSKDTPAKIFGQFALQVYNQSSEMIGKLEALRAETTRLTGGFEELTQQSMALAETAGFSGVSFARMQDSITGLIKSSSNFTELTAAQRKEVAINNAQLNALGISSDRAAKNFSIFTQSLGMTTNQANASARELVSLANALHMSPEEITNGFGEAAGTVAAYGKNAVTEFSKLAAESKALGLSIQELIGIVKGADTFQGAAEQAGKLNAMLGGGLLNSSQLLVASESERIQLIRDAVMQTGRSFESMSKYEQIALANAAGIQDLTVAQKLFNQQMDGDELDRYLGKTNALGMSQEEMEQQALKAQETQEKMNILMEQFAALMSPVVTAISKIVNLFMALAPAIKMAASFYAYLTFVKYGWIAAQNLWASRQTIMLGLESAWNAVRQQGVLGTLRVLAVRAWDMASMAAQKVLNYAFGSSIEFVNMAKSRQILLLLLLVGAFYLLYQVLHKSGSPMLYAIFGFMAIGLFLFGEALNKNKQGILAFGAGMMMVGVGAFMAFHGLEGFATALSKLSPEQLNALVLVIGLLTVALLVLFAGLGFLVYSGLGPAAAALLLAFGVSMLLAGAGALMLGMGLSMVIDSLVGLAANMAPLMMLPIFLQIMAISLVAVSIGLLIFTETLIGVGIAMMTFYVPILAAIGLISLLALAINSITPEKSIALKTTSDSIRNFIDTGNQITPDTVKNLDTVIEQIHKLNMEASITKVTNVTAPFKELIDAVNGQTKANAESDKTIVMKLDDRVFGSAVIKTMNTYGTANTAIRKSTPAGSGS